MSVARRNYSSQCEFDASPKGCEESQTPHICRGERGDVISTPLRILSVSQRLFANSDVNASAVWAVKRLRRFKAFVHVKALKGSLGNFNLLFTSPRVPLYLLYLPKQTKVNHF
jgi:hypothetical protein